METLESTTRRLSKTIKDIWAVRRHETRVQVERKMGGVIVGAFTDRHLDSEDAVTKVIIRDSQTSSNIEICIEDIRSFAELTN